MTAVSTQSDARSRTSRLGLVLTTAEADCRVAGVSVAGRTVGALSAAGLAEIGIVIARGWPLAAATLEDILRLSDGAAVTWLTEAEACARLAATAAGSTIVATTTYVITVDAVCAFEGASVPLATSAGAPVLWRPTGAGLAPPEAGAMPIALIPVDRRAHWRLVQTGGKPEDGVVSRLINRRISQPISGVLLRLAWIRPGHATILTAAFALAMAGCLFTGTQAGLIAGALLFQASSIIDGVDGEIARLTFRASKRGATLDSAVDATTNIAFLVGLTFNLTWQGRPYAHWLGLWSVGTVAFGLWLIGRQTVHAGQPLGFDLVKNRFDPRGVSWFALLIARAAIVVSSRDTFAFLFALSIASGFEMESLVIFASLTAIWIVVVLINTVFAHRAPAGDPCASPRFADV